MQWVAMDQAKYSQRVREDGKTMTNRHYFAGSQRDERAAGRGGVIVDAPHGFLTHRPAGEFIAPHFHDVPQYQIVVEGSGRLGKHPLAPVTVHYVDSYTPYGPIVGGDDGIAFFTLRSQITACDAQYMPQSRASLVRKAGRAFSVQVEPSEGTRQIIAATEDGLGARFLVLERGESARLEPSAGGRFVIVLEGQLADGPGKFACAFQTAGEAAEDVQAGAKGAKLLVLDFGDLTAEQRPLRAPAA